MARRKTKKKEWKDHEVLDVLERYATLASRNGSITEACANIMEDHPNFPLARRTCEQRISYILFARNARNEKPGAITEEVDEHGSAMSLNYDGLERITNLEEAIKFFGIDENAFEIVGFKANAWECSAMFEGEWKTTTNYQVTVQLKPRRDAFDMAQAKEDLKVWLNCNKKRRQKAATFAAREGIGVVAVSDIHIGAKNNASKGTVRTKNYDLKTAIEYMQQTADWVNAKQKKEVHLFLLGDLVESISGLNHLNSWQGMEEGIWYGNAIIVAFEVIHDFLAQIENLKSVSMVSGNHDRLTASKDMDSHGDACTLIAYMLNQAGIEVTYHPLVLAKVIDNISYVATHGHHNLAKQNLAKIILNYGKQDLYNVFLSGHLHTRKSKKDSTPVESILLDDVQYRGIVVPSLFTGNWYSETQGFTSSAGFAFLEAAANGKNVTHTDVGL